MRLLWIRLRNFLSFGAVSQTLRLDKRGLILVTGDNRDDPSLCANGAGKTSIIDAIVWCLYGVTSRKKYKGDDVINRFIGKDCEVEMAIEDDAGVAHRVLRARKSKTWKTCFRLWQLGPDDKLDPVLHRSCELTDKKGTQQRLEQILKMNLTTFMSTVIFGQSEAYRFSNLLPSQQQAVFDEALGLQQYAEAGRKAKDRLNAVERKLEALETELEASEKALRTARSYLKAHKSAEGRFAQEKKLRISHARGDLHAARGELAKAEDYVERIPSRKFQYEKADAAVRLVIENLDRSKRWLGMYEDRIESANHDAREFEQKIKRAKKLGKGDCSACGQAITPRTVKAHVSELKEKRDRLIAKREEAEQEIPRWRKEVTKDEKKLREAREDLYKRRKSLDEARRFKHDIPDLEQALSDALKKLRREKRAESSYGEMIAKERKTIAVHRAKIELLTSKQARLQRKVKQLEFWIEAFSANGLRSLIVENALPFLNTAAADITKHLTADNIEIRFNPQRKLKSGGTSDEFNIEVINKHGSSLLDGNSGGERAKIDVCIGLAMQSMIAARAAATCNLVIFDEPFDKMDDVAMDRVATFLTSLTRHETIALITHKESLKPYFSNILTVVKERDQSRIE